MIYIVVYKLTSILTSFLEVKWLKMTSNFLFCAPKYLQKDAKHILYCELLADLHFDLHFRDYMTKKDLYWPRFSMMTVDLDSAP